VIKPYNKEQPVCIMNAESTCTEIPSWATVYTLVFKLQDSVTHNHWLQCTTKSKRTHPSLSLKNLSQVHKV